MKILVGSEIGGYSFNKATKQVTLTGLNTLTLDRILLIINVTRNTIIYMPSSAGKGGAISANIITLTYNTNISDWQNTDVLQIFVDYPADLIPSAIRSLIITGTASFTRPADTIAYSISDVITNSTSAPVIQSITLARGNNIPFNIKSIRLFKSTNITANASFNLYLFNAAVTAINDNSPWTLLNADKAKYVARVGLTMFTEGSGSTGCMAEANGLNLNATSADSKLYTALVAAAAYQPGNAEIFDIFIDAEQQ